MPWASYPLISFATPDAIMSRHRFFRFLFGHQSLYIGRMPRGQSLLGAGKCTLEPKRLLRKMHFFDAPGLGSVHKSSFFTNVLPADVGSMILKIDPHHLALNMPHFGPMMPSISSGRCHLFHPFRSLSRSVFFFRLMSAICAVRDVARCPTKMRISCLRARWAGLFG